MADEGRVTETTEDGPPEGTIALDESKFRGSFSTTGEKPPVDTPPAEPPPGGPPAAKPAETPPSTPPAAKPAAGDPPKGIDSIIKRAREEASVELATEDDIVNEIKSSRDLKEKVQQAETRLSSLDPLAVDIDKAVKAGIDVDLYMDLRRMDIEKMDPKEALRRRFLIENDRLVKSDPELARLKFERDQKAKYPVLFEDLTDEEKVQKQSEIDYASRLMKNEAVEAKDFLTGYKKKHVTLPEPKDVTQETQKFWNDYLHGAETYTKGVESLEIPVEGGTFNLGAEEFVGEIHDKLKRPVDTLKEMGIDLENHSVDPAKLGDVLMKLKALEVIGPRLSTWLLEQQASRTVTETLTTAPPQPPAGGEQPPIDDHDTKVGKAFRAKREAQRQQGG